MSISVPLLIKRKIIQKKKEENTYNKSSLISFKLGQFYIILARLPTSSITRFLNKILK